jgi:hypothetical protein
MTLRSSLNETQVGRRGTQFVHSLFTNSERKRRLKERELKLSFLKEQNQ